MRRIHQHGMIKQHSDLRDPASRGVGGRRSPPWCSASTAPHAFQRARQRVGFELDELASTACSRNQGAGGQEEGVFDGDIEALVMRAEGAASGPWDSYRARDRGAQATAPGVRGAPAEHDGRSVELSASGDWPVWTPSLKAIEAATGIAGGAAQVRGAGGIRGRGTPRERHGVRGVHQSTYRGASVQHQYRRVRYPRVPRSDQSHRAGEAGARVREERSAPRPPEEAHAHSRHGSSIAFTASWCRGGKGHGAKCCRTRCIRSSVLFEGGCVA